MYYYKLKNKILFSFNEYKNLDAINDKDAKENTKDNNIIYFLGELNPEKSRRSFALSDPSLIFLEYEGINLINKNKTYKTNINIIPQWIQTKIHSKEVTFINTNYPNWESALDIYKPKKWKVNVLGLGDVGTTLLTGLRLLGDDSISEIGIYARSKNKVKRWVLEMNQVLSPFNSKSFPTVVGVSKEELFDCDMFVFCASKGVPPVGSDIDDVRMFQFKENSKIITEYGKMAREKDFKGIFAVVSDPVDLLCKVSFLESNRNESGELDFKGLAPEQIRGYGLGVMNARASYYAQQEEETIAYLNEGRAFGPHGDGLIIANSITNYDDAISNYLTEKAQTANLEVREIGFKPYIAPALSSGTLSILATIRGQWHYSATYMGGVFIGANNRYINSGIELEQLKLPELLINKLKNTYRKLEDII
ncbi:MAG: lactate dehydrogenase [Firmicutes bacterium]|nr:lactate dehydrogenase [Bacillota bacterium]